jgi:CRP-like cAMP-binding protein
MIDGPDRPYLNRFLRGRRQQEIAPEDMAALEAAAEGERAYRSRSVIVRTGEPVTVSTLLLDGFMCRYMDDRAGHRQLVAIHVPGDFVDLHGFPMGHLDHDVATIGPVRVVCWKHNDLEAVLAHRPKLTRMLWFSTLLDAAMHREWIFRLGRLDAIGRIAHLLSELDARLAMVGLSVDGRYRLPLTQADLGEACGLTGVHVNRVLRALRERDLALFRGGEVSILDRAGLRAVAEFDPLYLYGDGSGEP